MMTAEYTEIVCHGLSDVGIVREDNQDSIRVCEDFDIPHGCLYAVADGMGGYEQGGLASSLALDSLFDVFYAGDPNRPLQNLKSGIQQANLSIFKTAQRMGIARMGTTLTAVNIIGNKLYLAHIGDSRAYLIRDDKASCLTTDHTQVGELVRMRILSPDKVRTHAQRSVLNKCLGMDLLVQPDTSQTTLQAGDIIILCSDGVWSVIEDDEFGQIAAEESETQVMSQRLLDLAVKRESDDNMSVIAIHVRQLADSPAEQRRNWTVPQFLRGKFSARP